MSGSGAEAGVKGGQLMVGSRVAKRWWDQDGLDLEGMRTAVHEAERTEGEEEKDGDRLNR